MDSRTGEKFFNILIVEDNPGDVRLMQEALREGNVPCRLHVAPDGVVATSFLRRQGPHAGAPRPDFILMDLNVPRKHGTEDVGFAAHVLVRERMRHPGAPGDLANGDAGVPAFGEELASRVQDRRRRRFPPASSRARSLIAHAILPARVPAGRPDDMRAQTAPLLSISYPSVRCAQASRAAAGHPLLRACLAKRATRRAGRSRLDARAHAKRRSSWR